jgi:hypothetical protein
MRWTTGRTKAVTGYVAPMWTKCLTVLACVVLPACSGESFQPPARTAAIVAEETRVADLLEQAADAPGGGCAVRILGVDGPTTYAWATCVFRDAEGRESGSSIPIRVDGTAVLTPVDGGGYVDSIRAMFPERMAEAVLKDAERYKPDAL